MAESYVHCNAFKVTDYADVPGSGPVQGMCILPNGFTLLSRLGCGVYGLQPWGRGTVRLSLPPSVKSPKGMALLGDKVLLCDAGAHCIWEMPASGKSVSLFIGRPNVPGWRDGDVISNVLFKNPSSIAVSSSGTFVSIADTGNHCIRVLKIAAQGPQAVITVAGRPLPGYIDGFQTASMLNSPNAVIWSSSFMVVTDAGNHAIRLVTEESPGCWRTSTLAGCGKAGVRDGKASTAMFNHPSGVAFTASGALLVADKNNDRIRAVHAGQVTTISGRVGRGAKSNCPLRGAQYSSPTQIMCLGINDTIFLADSNNSKLRMIKKDPSPDWPNPTSRLEVLGAAPDSVPYEILSFDKAQRSYVEDPIKAAQAKRDRHTRPHGNEEGDPFELDSDEGTSPSPLVPRESPRMPRVRTTEEGGPSPSEFKAAAIARKPKLPPRERETAPSPGHAMAQHEVAGVFRRWLSLGSDSEKGMSCTQWLRLLGHCRLLTVRQDRCTVSTAAAGVVFFAAAGTAKRLSFEGFCRALNRLAAAMDPPMQPAHLVWSHILPFTNTTRIKEDPVHDASLIEPRVLTLLAVNEDTLLHIFKHFVDKHKVTCVAGETKREREARGRLLGMAGWLGFLRRFHLLPGLVGRHLAEGFLAQAVSGTLFTALIRNTHSLEEEIEHIRSVELQRRPGAPLLLSFPEFLDALCRLAFHCYHTTPAPEDRLASLLNALSQSDAASFFSQPPLFEVPMQRHESHDSTAAHDIYGTKFATRNPSCKVLLPTLRANIAHGVTDAEASIADSSLATMTQTVEGATLLRSNFSALRGGEPCLSPEAEGWEVQQGLDENEKEALQMSSRRLSFEEDAVPATRSPQKRRRASKARPTSPPKLVTLFEQSATLTQCVAKEENEKEEETMSLTSREFSESAAAKSVDQASSRSVMPLTQTEDSDTTSDNSSSSESGSTHDTSVRTTAMEPSRIEGSSTTSSSTPPSLHPATAEVSVFRETVLTVTSMSSSVQHDDTTMSDSSLSPFSRVSGSPSRQVSSNIVTQIPVTSFAFGSDTLEFESHMSSPASPGKDVWHLDVTGDGGQTESIDLETASSMQKPVVVIATEEQSVSSAASALPVFSTGKVDHPAIRSPTSMPSDTGSETTTHASPQTSIVSTPIAQPHLGTDSTFSTPLVKPSRKVVLSSEDTTSLSE